MPSKIIKVKVSAGVKTEKVEEISPDVFKIRVQTAPEKGKANKRVRELLADYFDISLSRVFLVSGTKSREKIFSINLN